MKDYINIKTEGAVLVFHGPNKRRHFLFPHKGITAATSELHEAAHVTKAMKALWHQRGESVYLVAGLIDKVGAVLCYEATFDKNGLVIGDQIEVDFENTNEGIAYALQVLFQALSEASQPWSAWVEQQRLDAVASVQDRLGIDEIGHEAASNG